MYVETDFLLAIVKSDDRLQEQAHAVLADDSAEVHTSLLAFAELLTLAYDPGEGIEFDVPHVVGNLVQKVPIRPKRHEMATLAAAIFLEEHDITPFDAFHAGVTVTGGHRILSSDRVYDDLDLDRVPLEPSV